MQNTPKSLRLQIGIFGRRNVGKSALLNALTGQEVSIVADYPGTTTDPVEKAMEMPPLGPVLWIDTAGLDDDEVISAIGALRTERTRRVFERIDMALLVSTTDQWGRFEEDLFHEFQERKIPVIVAMNKIDIAPISDLFLEDFTEIKQKMVRVSAKTGEGLDELKEAIVELAPEDFLSSGGLLGDLVKPQKAVLLITPVDSEAPKGRMILPQAQATRDALDHDAYCITAKENAVASALANMKELPVLAITDSRIFAAADALLPREIPLTSFSILLARQKGDLAVCAVGAAAIASLKPASKILIAEACSHHAVEEDIGRVKIPQWLEKYVGGKLDFTFAQGADFPKDLSPFKLVIHCGACMFNRRAVLSRILQCQKQQVPFTNYGVAIAFLHGILERALTPFPDALNHFLEASKNNECEPGD